MVSAVLASVAARVYCTDYDVSVLDNCKRNMQANPHFRYVPMAH